jgi:hypothetical protein
MTALDFIDWFKSHLHAAKIEFALTSGQACVYYGIQQTTKDSDWIIGPADLSKLCELFSRLESENCRIEYRQFCGAPLVEDYLAGGWTSHLSLHDSAGQEHHLDFFGKPPRVTSLERDSENSDYANRVTVAQMKKTDREKDWPIVFSLGQQAISAGDIRGVLYGMEAEWLVSVWENVSFENRSTLVVQRPLLGIVDREPKRLKRCLLIEKYLWATVNRGRYHLYTRHWKDFYHQWRQEPGFVWPMNASFAQQHDKLTQAVLRYQLPFDVVYANRAAIIAKAAAETMEVFAATEDELNAIMPPVELLLP